jgi:hypothetical protein
LEGQQPDLEVSLCRITSDQLTPLTTTQISCVRIITRQCWQQPLHDINKLEENLYEGIRGSGKNYIHLHVHIEVHFIQKHIQLID